jgi:tRNA (guanine37-N1)-methyltransferase
MDIDVITLFPGMFDAITDYGVTSRAVKKGLLAVNCWNPRDYTEDRHRTVDDRPYGGGPGMVMKTDPLEKTLDDILGQKSSTRKVIYLSPQGQKFDHSMAKEFSALPGFILLSGRYEGVDERFLDDRVDHEISIGDFVLTGGELAAMLMIDAIARLIPGVLGNECPEVLLSGNHEAIRIWRLKQSLGRTWLRRPELLTKVDLDKEQEKLLNEFKCEFKQEHESRR